MFCREQAARFDRHRDAIAALGARTIAIGNGTPLMARDFVERFNIQMPVYTDPERSSYRLAGLKRNFGLGFKSLAAGRRALQGGFVQGRTRGDPWQQGGVLIVRSGSSDHRGEILWRHVDEGAGDHAEPQAVLDVLRGR